jgi:antitoxin (DNA-binding transcriptional repressor) of toxin-antitoxin stability system
MKFLTVRDFVVNQKKTRQTISREQAIITYNGKPIAALYPLNENDFSSFVKEQSAVWAMQAMRNSQQRPRKHKLTQKEIDEAIQEVREQIRKEKGK